MASENNVPDQTLGMSPKHSNQPVVGTDKHRSVKFSGFKPKERRGNSPRPSGLSTEPKVLVETKLADWNAQVEREERSRTSSVAEVICDDSTPDFGAAAASAAGKAASLLVQAEKARTDADLLLQIATNQDKIIGDDQIILVRQYSGQSLEEVKGLPKEDFANILANLDSMAIKQLKILFSACRTLIEDSDPNFQSGSVNIPIQPLAIATQQCSGNASQATSYSGVASRVPPATTTSTSRGRSTSRIRANAVQGGVRVNLNGGRVDFDNKIYQDPSGKRYRMQAPQPKSAARLKAEAQVQTIVRRLREFGNAHGISKDCRPNVGTDLESEYNVLMLELQTSKDKLKQVKSEEALKPPAKGRRK